MLLCKNNAGMQSLLAEITWTRLNVRFQVKVSLRQHYLHQVQWV